MRGKRETAAFGSAAPWRRNDEACRFFATSRNIAAASHVHSHDRDPS